MQKRRQILGKVLLLVPLHRLGDGLLEHVGVILCLKLVLSILKIFLDSFPPWQIPWVKYISAITDQSKYLTAMSMLDHRKNKRGISGSESNQVEFVLVETKYFKIKST